MGAPTPYIVVFEAHPHGALMAKKKTKTNKRERRTFTKEFKQEAVQMLLDGHSASSVSKNLGIGNANQSEQGATTQAVLMSVFRTLKLRKLHPLNTILDALAEYNRTGILPALPESTSGN
jgi:hypothetical protein